MNNFCPVENDTIRHYAEMDSADNLQSEVNRYVKFYTEDGQGIGTLRDEDSSLEDAVEKLLLEIVTHPVDSRTIEQVKQFRLGVFVSAAKLAGRKIAQNIIEAQEQAAIERYERRCEL